MKGFTEMEVAALLKGDREAQNRLFADVTSYVRVQCFKKGYNHYFSEQDLDDIANIAYFKIIKGLHTYKTDRSFSKWEHSVIHNALKDYLDDCMDGLNHLYHVESYESVSYDSETADEKSCYDGDVMEPMTYNGFFGPVSAAADEELTYFELENRIEEILPARAFRIFMMRANGCEYEEVAQENGVTVGNARTIFRRAKEILQERLIAA